jgi:2,4-dienoyl-CoA reductase-like NADH-dependent reductase (Old Yellow Enzyme family)
MHEDVWQRAGFTEAAGLAPGQSDEASLERIRELCADVLGQHSLVGNNSRWTTFGTVQCQTWRHENVVLIGDAAHTAHFSIGSGTKLAMEDALALAACLHERPDADEALAAYETERRPVVASTQRAAQASLEWFENLGQYAGQDPHQFAFNIMTRSRRVTYDNLRLRDPEFVAAMDEWFAVSQEDAREAGPPMFQPFRIGRLELANRVIVSPMDMYSAADGVPGDFHLVHLGGKALGGAGLVMTEMVCVSPTGRITPGCTGIYTAEQEDSWRRITAFVHDRTRAKIGIQLGHSGRKGSTRLMWEGMDAPLPEGNWEVCGPSALPYSARNQTPRELATDWHPDGLDIDDTIEIARAFAEHGAAGIDVSTGQVVSDEQPAFGRSYQTPYADRIRNEIGTKYGVAVIAVGAISSYDDVNSIILAGRADLCALGRTHLYDPQWTLHAAAEQEYTGPGAVWPDPFAAGSRRPQGGRTDGPRPRLELIRAGTPDTAHARWRPRAAS